MPDPTRRRRAGAGKRDAAGARQRTSSRAEILEAALAIADGDGLDGLTIRKLAERLGISPMGIYRYFRNKAEIVEELVDLVVGKYDVTNHHETDWAEWISTAFCLMRRGLRDHPGVIPLLGTVASSGPNAMAVMEEVLRVLRSGGLERRAAAGAFHTLISYTIGSVAIESHVHGRPVGEELDAEERLRQSRVLFEAAPRSLYPSVVEHAEHLASHGTDDEFVRGLRRILAGLKAEARNTRSKSRRGSS
jgi:AcrR family transcriptional regulator